MSGNYKYVSTEMDAAAASITALGNALLADLDSLKSSAETLVSTQEMDGNTCGKMKDYLSTVYPSLQASFHMMFYAFQSKFVQYRAEYGMLDSATNAVIDTEEIESIDIELEAQMQSKDDVQRAINTAINSICGIAAISFKGLSSVPDEHSDIHEKIQDILTTVSGIEDKYTDVSSIENMISSLEAQLNDMLAQPTIYKKNFSATAYAMSGAYVALSAAFTELQREVNAEKEDIEAAYEWQDGHYELLEEERQQRAEEAQRVQWIVAGALIIVGAAVTIATAGAGSPVLVAAISGGVTGAINAGLSKGAEMYVEGGWDNVDWNDVGKEAFIGGVKGAVVGAVSAGATEALGTAITGSLPDGAPAVLKVVGKGVEKGISNVVSKGTGRMVEATLREMIDDDYSGEDPLASTFDAKEIVGDFAGGFVKGATGEGVKQIANTIADTDNIKSPLVKGGIGAIKSTAGGITGSFVETMITEEGTLSERFDAAVDKAFDAETIITDAVSGFAEDASEAYAEQRARMQNATEAAQKRNHYNTVDEDGNPQADISGIYAENGVEGVKTTKMGNADFEDTDIIYEVDGEKANVNIVMEDRDDYKYRGSDYSAAEKAYREKIGDPDWKTPDGYTWHHVDIAPDPITGELRTGMQLVKTDAHDKGQGGFNHTGSISQRHHYLDDEVDDITVVKGKTQHSIEVTENERMVRWDLPSQDALNCLFA